MLEETKFLYEIYKERSFSAAAKNLYISQPALSTAVRKVEERLGVRLFDRSTTPLTLTDAGKLYLESLERVMAVEGELMERLNDLSGRRAGHLIVCGGNFVSGFVLPKIILNFTRRYEGIRVELEESNTPDLQNRLLEDAVDLMIAHDFDAARFSSYPLLDETVLLCVPREFAVNRRLEGCQLTDADVRAGRHHDADCPRAPLEAFRDDPFLIIKKGSDMNARSMRLCEEAGFTPRTILEVDQLITSYNMANAGLGAAFVSDAMICSTPDVGNCCFYKLRGPLIHRKLSIGYRRGRYLSHAARAFIEVAEETCRPGDET